MGRFKKQKFRDKFPFETKMIRVSKDFRRDLKMQKEREEFDGTLEEFTHFKALKKKKKGRGLFDDFKI